MMTKSHSNTYTPQIVLDLCDARMFADGWISMDSGGHWRFHPSAPDKRITPSFCYWTGEGDMEIFAMHEDYSPLRSDQWEDSLIHTRELEALQKAARAGV